MRARSRVCICSCSQRRRHGLSSHADHQASAAHRSTRPWCHGLGTATLGHVSARRRGRAGGTGSLPPPSSDPMPEVRSFLMQTRHRCAPHVSPLFLWAH